MSHGIKETEEALKGILALSMFLYTRLKDGADIADAWAIFSEVRSDSDFGKLVQAAYDNCQAIPAEVRDIDLKEAFALVNVAADFIQAFIENTKAE